MLRAIDDADQTSRLVVADEKCSPLIYVDHRVTLFVYSQLGDRCVIPSIVIPTVLIYGLLLALGVVGNVCTCLVIMRNKYMQNATNYYLALVLLTHMYNVEPHSLAISDLFMLILGLPMELYGIFDVIYPYRFGEFVCKLRAFLIEFTSDASILTITCFSVERWLAICFPLRVKLFSTTDRAVKVIIAVWICAFIASLPVASIVVLNRLPLPDFVLHDVVLIAKISPDNRTIIGTDYCAMDFERPFAQKSFIFSAFFFFFLLPAVLITCVYCHIFCKLQGLSAVPLKKSVLYSSAVPSANHSANGSSRKRSNLPPFVFASSSKASCTSMRPYCSPMKKVSKSNSVVGSSSSIVVTSSATGAVAVNCCNTSDNQMLKHENYKARKSSLKILFAVVLMFFLCWLPFHLQRLLSIFLNEAMDERSSGSNSGSNHHDDASRTNITLTTSTELNRSANGGDNPSNTVTAVHSIFNVVFYISGYCFYSNSACNPILYNILSEKYRLAFCKTILGVRLTDKIFMSKHRQSLMNWSAKHHRQSSMPKTFSRCSKSNSNPYCRPEARKSFWVTANGSIIQQPAATINDNSAKARHHKPFRRFWSFDENDSSAAIRRECSSGTFCKSLKFTGASSEVKMSNDSLTGDERYSRNGTTVTTVEAIPH